jgi:two-component system NarL family response regulator
LTLEAALEQARVLVGPEPAPTSGAVSAGLTAREHEVAVLLARGMSNRQIAETLIITEKTAKNHVQRVLEKVGLHSRSELAAQAGALGLRG